MSTYPKTTGLPVPTERDIHILRALWLDIKWWDTRIEPRFAEDPNGCLLWTGAPSHDGYGVVRIPKQVAAVNAYVHRVAYIRFTGEPVPAETLDHLCKVRLCANVSHLEPTSMKENNLRGDSPMAIQAKQTHCQNGHELSEANLAKSALEQRNERRCVACQKEQDKERFALISLATRSLGLQHKEYVRIYGQSQKTAMKILGVTDDDN